MSWLPTLEKIIEDYCEDYSSHPDYRLWLSSSPTPKFPLTILQRGIKMTTEPPKGLKANLLRMYNLIKTSDFERCQQQSKYKKLLFCLSWFHAVLLERRKFKGLGFNIPYDFNDADFLICENILAMYLDEYPTQTPWDAMRYLIAQANYGGRITDDWDRRLCLVYVNQFFNEEVLEVDNYNLVELEGSTNSQYYVPDDGSLESYKDYIRGLPLVDLPSCFGQHSNADVSSMMLNARDMLETVLSLQPRVASGGGVSNDDKVKATVLDLKTKLPGAINLAEAKDTLAGRSDPGALKSVLFQEMDRYNVLLKKMKVSLDSLELGIDGVVPITMELEKVYDALLSGQVPALWGFCYPSLKPLGSWMRDLQDRIAFFRGWLDDGLPKTYWLSGFTYPTGFLTALLQTSARKNGVSIDSLSWDFPVLLDDPATVKTHVKEGALVYGMFLEGARWNRDEGCLADAHPLELIADMPMVHFKPVEGADSAKKKKKKRDMYTCPLYLYPIRTGTRERPSFMIAVELRGGGLKPEYWTKRATALLLATSL